MCVGGGVYVCVLGGRAYEWGGECKAYVWGIAEGVTYVGLTGKQRVQEVGGICMGNKGLLNAGGGGGGLCIGNKGLMNGGVSCMGFRLH